jgi:hypothetical protein
MFVTCGVSSLLRNCFLTTSSQIFEAVLNSISAYFVISAPEKTAATRFPDFRPTSSRQKNHVRRAYRLC